MLNKKIENYGDILTPKDVKEILGIGYNTTYSLLKNGTIKSFKVGRCRKIPKECLEAYVAEMLST